MNSNRCLNAAAKCGDLACVRYCLDRDGVTYTLATYEAAVNGHWHVVKEITERYRIDLEYLRRRLPQDEYERVQRSAKRPPADNIHVAEESVLEDEMIVWASE